MSSAAAWSAIDPQVVLVHERSIRASAKPEVARGEHAVKRASRRGRYVAVAMTSSRTHPALAVPRPPSESIAAMRVDAPRAEPALAKLFAAANETHRCARGGTCSR